MPADGPSPEDSSIPAVVPEEFRDAYQAAFDEALRAQATNAPGEHADRSSTRRQRRTDAISRASGPQTRVGSEPTTYERVRDSGWFVPALLLALVLLLLAGAYLLGRQFSAHVGSGTHAVGPASAGGDVAG